MIHDEELALTFDSWNGTFNRLKVCDLKKWIWNMIFEYKAHVRNCDHSKIDFRWTKFNNENIDVTMLINRKGRSNFQSNRSIWYYQPTVVKWLQEEAKFSWKLDLNQQILVNKILNLSRIFYEKFLEKKSWLQEPGMRYIPQTFELVFLLVMNNLSNSQLFGEKRA